MCETIYYKKMIFNKVHTYRLLRCAALFILFALFQITPGITFTTQAASIVTSEQIQSFYTTGILSYENVAFKFIPEDAKKINRPDILIQRVQRFYDAYKSMMGNVPFQGKQISFVERCNAVEGKNDNSITPECPYGYTIGYWGYFMGTPDITITKAGIQNVIDDANSDSVTFGLVHELSHAFDYWDNAQYIYNSTSTEALANIKLVHAIDVTGVKIHLGSSTYSSTKEFLSNFYMPFYDQYVTNRYAYSDLDDDNPVVGNKADMYLALLEKGIEKTSPTCFFDTLKRYPTNKNLTTYSSTNKTEKFNQFLSLWSEQCQSSALVDVFTNANFPISTALKNEVSKYTLPIQNSIPPEPVISNTPVVLSQPTPTGSQTSFRDISGHFAEQAIIALQKKGIISGKTSSIFAPYEYLNRAEASKLITEAFISSASANTFLKDLRIQHPNYTYVFFKDVDIQSWYAGYIGILQSYGIIQGGSVHTFRPNQTVTKAEFLKMILRARGDNIEYLNNQYSAETTERFSDVPENAWYYPIVYAGTKLHIVDIEKYFSPNKALSRGEAAFMLDKSL